MELFVFLIPFFVSAVLLIFFRKQTTWWEHAVLIIPSLFARVKNKILIIKDEMPVARESGRRFHVKEIRFS